MGNVIEENVRLGHPMLIVCATNIKSNPAPTIIWYSPLGLVQSGPGYTFTNNKSIIMLNVQKTKAVHEGLWTCTVKVEGRNVTDSNGNIHPLLDVGIKTVSFNVHIFGKSILCIIMYN